MQFPLVLYLFVLRLTLTVNAFRDYPANYSNQSTFINNSQSIKKTRSTFYEKSLSYILSRKKRGFVFFKGSVVVLTQVLSKHVVVTVPRGLLQSTEIDMFYDVPILIEGWKKPLEAFANRTKGGKKSDQIVYSIEDEKNKNIGVINASSIPWDKYYKTSFRPKLNQFVWNNQNSSKRIIHPNQKYFYRKPYRKGSFSQYHDPNYQRRIYHQPRNENKNNMQKQLYQYRTANYKQINKPHKPRPQKSKYVNPSWHEHREYRERRGIFEHVEAFGEKLGVSLRSCILRAICEIKTELLPEGESFINDVARILFTIPTNHDSKDDDFVQMALDDSVDCKRRFMVSCPHSPLKYFFKHFKATNLPPMSEQDMMNNIMYA